MRALIAATLLVFAACSPGTTAAPSPGAATASPNAAAGTPVPASAGPVATATPSVSPSPAATPAPTAGPQLTYPVRLNYANEVAMQVIVSGLNVRARPSTSGAKLAKAPKGAVFVFRDAPVKANGFEWYFGYQAVASGGKLPDLPAALASGIDPLAGWIAAGTSDSPYLAPLAPRCPVSVDLENVQAMLDSERVACFGSNPIELRGTYGCGGCGGANAGEYTPSWLADPLAYHFLSIEPSSQIGPLWLRFPPDGPTPPADGTIIKVRAHLADSRSSTCVIAPLGEGDVPAPIPTGIARDYCRAQLVVDSFDDLGPDPRFPQ
jgi:hypothetical protein